MIESGIIVGLALLFTLAKMSWSWKLRVLSHPVMIDVVVFIFLVFVHWGTFTGVMAATIGALMCSMVLTAGRWLFGYYENGKRVPGVFDVSAKLGK